MHVAEFSGNLVDSCRLHTKSLIGRQRLTGKLEQNAFKGRGCGRHRISARFSRLQSVQSYSVIRNNALVILSEAKDLCSSAGGDYIGPSLTGMWYLNRIKKGRPLGAPY